MTTTLDLINAIESGKSTDIQNSFDDIVNEKMRVAINSYREAVVETLFQEEDNG